MIKKYLVLCAFISLIVLFIVGPGWIKHNKKDKDIIPPQAGDLARDEVIDSGARQLKRAKVILESQDWTITLRPLLGSGGAAEDVLTFSEGRFISRNLFGRDYPQVKYSLSPQGEGITVWEAFQEGREGGLASWRAELKSESVMQGCLSIQSAGKGPLEDFYFEAGLKDESSRKADTDAKGLSIQKKRRVR